MRQASRQTFPLRSFRVKRWMGFVASVLIVAGIESRVSAQDPLTSARDLYASARYDEALNLLNRLKADPALGPDGLRDIEQYRSFCLIALGRATEADAALTAVVKTDPLHKLDDTDASPRVRAAFRETRRKLLPELATQEYATAKASFDNKQYQAAADQFGRVLALLDDPDMPGRQADFRTLVVGFLDLSGSAAAPPPQAKVEPSPPLKPQAAPVPAAPRVYGMSEADVTPPGVIRQQLPRVPGNLKAQIFGRGVLEIVITEMGTVEAVALRQRIHPLYDAMVLEAAMTWRYQPATRQGVPVKYRKLIQISLDPR